MPTNPVVLVDRPISLAPAAKLVLSVTPNTGLARDGATVQVAGSGFPNGKRIVLSQCSGTLCDPKVVVTSTKTGTLSRSMVVKYALSSDFCTTTCRMRASVERLPSVYAQQAIIFGTR